MAEIKIEVEGMTCGGCASRVTSALQLDPRVDYAIVDFATRSGMVRGEVSRDDIKKIIESVGYHLAKQDDRDEASRALAASKELNAGLLKIFIAAAMSIPVVIVAMGPWHFAHGDAIQAVLTTAFLVGPASGFFIRFLKQLRLGFVTMDALVSIGMLSAWAISIALMGQGQGHLYFESAAMIGFFVLLGKFIEDRARLRSIADISKLMRMRPRTVFLAPPDAAPAEVDAGQVRLDDRVYIRPGDMAAFDGELLEPAVSFDESVLSGESVPVTKNPGDWISSGSVNASGVGAYIKVKRVGDDTTMARIVKMMEDARLSRPKIQKLADKISSVFVPIVMVLATLTFMIVWLSGNGVEAGIMRGLSVLVVACPCALGLATPVAWVAGLGRAARSGVLIKSYEGLDELRQVKAIVFDKTGTLTMGRPEVTQVIMPDAVGQEELAGIFSAMSHSSHPLARAIMIWIKSRVDVSKAPLSKLISDVPGHGVECDIKGASPAKIKFGRATYVAAIIPAEWSQADESENMTVAVSRDGVPRILFCLRDHLRPEAGDVLRDLKKMGMEVHVASGDRQSVVDELKNQFPMLDSAMGAMTPAAKKTFIDQIRARGIKVAFIGDGINDAPALAAANVGASIGGGSDLAAQSADLVLQRQGVAAIFAAIRLSRDISKIINQNFFWAFFYNIAAIPAAASGHMTPMWASAAMALSSVTVVLNALRLRLRK
jgi:Cu+-exporting ATPase